MPEWYQSPRWSQEITDCSMPMTFDTYSVCSYNCHYCFSIYQRDIGKSKENYRNRNVRSVNPKEVKAIFSGKPSQFSKYIEKRLAMQWGGLSDQFDEYERRYGITLELLRFFRDLKYPICFSTKATWWAFDDRYRDLFQGADHFNTKFSVIMLNPDSARKIEAGCPSPQERLKAMAEIAKLNPKGGVTLRLRPYIIGCSDKDVKELIKQAAECGASAVSIEFFCLEQRSISGVNYHFPIISKVVGFDITNWYRKRSRGAGYMRLTRDIKRPYVDEMEGLCREYGLRFYVSDAHFKERCHNGSCCGLSEDWNYTRGQGCEALMIAKKTGQVHWSDISPHLDYLEDVPWDGAKGYNISTSERRAAYRGFSMVDYLRYTWNHPKLGQSPYMMFEGVIKPIGIDESGDLVYEIDKSRL
jgi:DNA repair photolyase